QTLLEVGEVIHAYRDLNQLFRNLAESLRRVIFFDGVVVGLLDATKSLITLKLAENWGAFPPEIGRTVPLSAVPAEVSVREQRPFRFSVHKHAALYPLHAEVLERVKWQTTYTFPLSTSITQLGGIAFVFKDDVHLTEKELGFIQQVADQVALAIENAQNFQEAQTTRSALERRNAQQSVLLRLTNYLVSNLDFKELLQAVATGVRRAVPCACVSVVLPTLDQSFLSVEALDFPDSRGFFTQHYTVPMEG